MASVLQPLSTGAQGSLGSPCWLVWAWRQVPVIGFQARNSAIAWATGWGRWMCRRWPTPWMVQSLTCGNQEWSRGRPSTNSCTVSAPRTERTGWEDGGRLLGSERPGGDGWEFDAEEGVGVLDCLGDATRNVRVDYGLAGLPVQTAHCAQEAGHCPLVVASGEGLQGRRRVLEEGGRAGHREQRRPRRDHPTPTCSAHRCSRRRSRSNSRPATSAGPDQPPTSWSSSPPDSRAERCSPAQPWLEEGSGSPKAMRRGRNSPYRKRCDAGTTSAPPMRRRSHAWP